MEEIVKSAWFPFYTGIASILGLLLALYPIQIHPLHSSEYRTLQWKKTLLTAIGIGITIWSFIQIYFKVSPQYEWIKNPAYDYSIFQDNCSEKQIAPQSGCEFEVSFMPTTSFYKRSASIEIKTSQVFSQTFSIELEGKGTALIPDEFISVSQGVILRSSPLFSDANIKNANLFIKKLENDTNQSTKLLSMFIWKKIDATKRQILIDPKSTTQQQHSTLVEALNDIIKGD